MIEIIVNDQEINSSMKSVDKGRDTMNKRLEEYTFLSSIFWIMGMRGKIVIFSVLSEPFDPNLKTQADDIVPSL